MSTGVFDPQAHAAAMRAQGVWHDELLNEHLARSVAQTPEKPAVVAYRAGQAQPERITYAEFEERVAKLAGAMRARGIGAGDIVGLQLPNWWEFAVTVLACERIGAVVNPLMPIFREHELSYMLGFAEAKMLIVPKIFRGFDHAAMAASLQARLPSLQHVIVVHGDGENSFANLLQSGTPVHATHRALQPDAMAVLMFTSGTTGAPKGVMHSVNGILACTYAMSARAGLTDKDVVFGCSPLGHMTGYAASLALSMQLGATLVLLDVWEARNGVAVMAAEGASYIVASTPFLSDLCETVATGAPRPTHLHRFICGGAPIPPVLVERAARELDLQVCSLWGMTEALGATMTEPSRAAEKSSTTDGRALDGMEVCVTGADGKPLPLGETGDLLVRGAQMLLGYYKQPLEGIFTPDGWFATGDLAYLDTEGYIRINGRTKDVLIRGGENVPVAEIESLLYRHPAVASVAIVGIPDARLGERGCAFVALRPGAQLDLAGVQAYLNEAKVAKQYWPEWLEVLAALPCTPSGKIKKFVLKDQAKAFAT
jgi:cyclohexanecarboxylate-CoA ligase